MKHGSQAKWAKPSLSQLFQFLRNCCTMLPITISRDLTPHSTSHCLLCSSRCHQKKELWRKCLYPLLSWGGWGQAGWFSGYPDDQRYSSRLHQDFFEDDQEIWEMLPNSIGNEDRAQEGMAQMPLKCAMWWHTWP